MNEKRFTTKGIIISNYGVWDTNDKPYANDDVVDLLNEQQSIICRDGLSIKTMMSNMEKLEEENKQLRQMIKAYVFGRYVEGSLADLKFKAIAYDDIVKLELSNESEPKVIVICKQGKKEKVKSFCQMFIPFGVCYEIKEMMFDE